MKNSSCARSGVASFKLKPTMVLAGQATAGVFWALAATGSVHAQAAAAPATPASAAAAPAAAASAPVDQSVVVYGIRKGIEDAISVKKNSDNIVEAISAEDIGKLPDSSIAESIARLPGLAAQRVEGRAEVISIRGTSPDLSTTLLNGREQVSTGDNRSVEFDQYPSELMAGVVVYKTPDAGLIGQGLSGTIDMQTVKPLSFPGRTVTITAKGEHNSLGKVANTSPTGNRFSLSYIDQFADHTIGVAFGYAHQQSPVLDHEFGAYEPWHDDTNSDNKTSGRTGVPIHTFVTDGAKILARSGSDKRDAFIGVLEFRPNSSWTTQVDLYSSSDKREETANQFEVNLSNYPTTNIFSNLTIDSNNTLTGATVANTVPLVRGMYYDRKDTINAIGVNNKLKLGDATLVGDISYSKSTKDELSLENNMQLGPSGTNVLDTVTYNVGSGFPQLRAGLDYSDPAKLQLGPTIYGQGYGKKPHVEDELSAGKLSASMPAPVLSSVFSEFEVGVNYSDREKKKRQPEANLTAVGTPSISSDLLYSPTNLGFAGGGVIPTWNVPGVVAKYFSPFAPSETAAQYLVQKAWDVTEKVASGFFKADIDSQVGGLGLRGNVGLQIIHTDQSSSGHYTNTYPDPANPNGTKFDILPITAGKTYNDVLPALNLALDLGSQQTLRLGLARQMARPRLDQLRVPVDFGVSTVRDGNGNLAPGGSGGNPKLDPWRANAFDLTYEKYFGTKAYLSAQFFYKDLKSYIYQQSEVYDFSAFTPGTTATTNFGQFTAPFNGKGGKLQGIELTASLPLGMLFAPLDGFGFQASGSRTNSRIKIQDPNSNIGSNIPLPGLSKNVTDLTFYYEKAGFEARISQRQRSTFVGEIANFANDRTLRYVVGERVVDMQLGYTFLSGPLKDLAFQLAISNLNDAPYETYGASPDRVYEYQKFGRTVLFGGSYKF
ncbi:MAG: TonB-dependent receptor [Pseudomonadota bacterium]|nr:TonB-dependent receptor [Pseudomonadota bacterium]